MNNTNTSIPNLTSKLRQNIVTSPECIGSASGIKIFGKKIRSIAYTTDVAVIANCDADAILAVYPWTPNTRILDAISRVANVPVLAGIGGGLTKGLRSATIGRFAEEMGASGVVLNAPTKINTILTVRKAVDIPVIYTVVNKEVNLHVLIQSGVSAFNVAGGKSTSDLVAWIRDSLKDDYPDFPIIASGGRSEEGMKNTIKAGANCITYAANSLTETIFKEKMEKYRNSEIGN